jgi:hypothetical protein
MIEFRKFSDFPRGTMYDILQDAYSFDSRNKQIWDMNWKESDDFFYDNPEIAEKFGLVSCIDGEPIGFVTWDPRNRPKYVDIGHNGIREKYKRQEYGHRQQEEAVCRIKEYEGLKRIIVCTADNLAIHIERPYDNPFVTIPGAYHTLFDFMRTNDLERVDKEVIPYFETDGESMDVYIACK